jgi:hypothetical protein
MFWPERQPRLPMMKAIAAAVETAIQLKIVSMPNGGLDLRRLPCARQPPSTAIRHTPIEMPSQM